jgi:hypothetical protein
MAPTREGSAAIIFADVNRQLAHLPPDVTTLNDGALNDDAFSLPPRDDAHQDATTEEDKNIAMMDAHVRAILAGADYRLSVLSTALGRGVARNTPLPLLADSSITEHIAEIYDFYYKDTRSDDESLIDPLASHHPLTPYAAPTSPPQESSSVPNHIHDDINYNNAIPRRLFHPAQSRIVESARLKPVPKARYDESSSAPAPALRHRYHHCLPLNGVLPHPPMVLDAPPFHPTPAWATLLPFSTPTLTSPPQLRLGSLFTGTIIITSTVPSPNPLPGERSAATTPPLQPPVIPARTTTLTCNRTLSR